MDNDFLWLVVAFIVILGFVALQERSGKSKVMRALQEKGCQKIKVTTKMFVGGQGALTFEVEYQDNNGVLQQNSCVVHTGMFSDEKIYWEKPLE